MATGDEGTSITHMCLGKITTDDGVWVGFNAPENTGGKHYVYDYHSSDEIKIIDQNEKKLFIAFILDLRVIAVCAELGAAV